MAHLESQTQSNARQPDLDWSQIRETVSMLIAATASVESAMRDGNSSVSALANSFTGIVGHIAAMDQAIATMAEGELKSTMMQDSAAASRKVQASIVEFQFYDKLQQRLEHVSASLSALADIVSTPHRLYNPSEWSEFQHFIRSRFTIESDAKMFDAIMKGKSIKEAVSIAIQHTKLNTENDDIELF